MRRVQSTLAFCVAILTLVASPIQAQGNPGPDVIVGDLHNFTNYSHSGGIDAFSFGTTSCNIGTQNLDWFQAPNPLHPVIAQNLFRLHNGRFEQLGQAWLKHGFFALDQSLCDNCNATGGTTLGVGCSDPYGASLNGSQSGLGAKSDVNAFTGVFPGNYTGQGGTGNSIFKRVQVKTADLDPVAYAGARYFAEGHYVTQDDSAADNAHNNASWREVQFSPSGGGFSVSFPGGSMTERGEPAILVWGDIDPTVQLQAVDVPGEGRYWVGFKATDNGNGTSDYEFAVHNLNSDRSGGSFSVAMPNGANVTGIDFHDVDYHSGEPYGGADWIGSHGGGAITWATTPHATNPNANALRWGTLYNFRFTSDTSPGAVTLGLFKPGTPNSVSFTVSPPQPPGALADGSFEMQTSGAAPASPWNTSGSDHVINPDGGTTSDGGFPVQGSQWCEISASSTNAATPPSNPGGVGSSASGGAGVSQTFSYDPGLTLFSFSGSFIRNEGANQSQFNDFMSVDITDGGTSINLFYKDTFSPTSGNSAKHGLPITALDTVQVDLAALFPSSTSSTLFTISAVVGNGFDGIQPSLGYVDEFKLEGSTPGAPTADFTSDVTSGLVPLNVNFTANTTGSVSTYLWAFGDGSFSSAQNPSHTYGIVGSFDVSLTVTGPGGSDTETKNAYVDVMQLPPPQAEFLGIPTSGVFPLNVIFVNQSTGNFGSQSWAFGDGGTSNLSNPSHLYSAPGVYDVTLTVTGPGGSDAEVKTGYITVNDVAPVAEFGAMPTSGPPGTVVNFTDLTSGNATSFNWNFGDGGGSTAQNPSHTYMTAGSYTVSLTATGPGGSDTETKVDFIDIEVPVVGDQLFISFDDTTFVPGVGNVEDEDVVVLDTQTGQWSLYFDGSDIGLGPTGIDAFHILESNGSVLFTISDDNFSYPGIGFAPPGGLIDGSDIIYFFPSSLGQTTAGLAFFLFDGSDVGLSDPGENIDGLHLSNFGEILISTDGPPIVPGVGTIQDEDLLFIFPAAYFSNTAGSFLFAFDGSDVGLGSGGEDINGIYFDTQTFSLFFTTTGAMNASGATADNEDVSSFNGGYGVNTSGSITPIFDLSAFGIAPTASVNGISFIRNN